VKRYLQAVLLAFLLGATTLFGQQPASTPSQPAEQKATSTPGEAPEHPIRDAQRELAHNENEAVGREVSPDKETPGEEADENQQFKESPSVKWFAAHTGLSTQAAYWLLVCINFAIIAGFIVWAWKKNVPAMFRTRTETIRKNLDEARRASEEANRRLGDIESRLAKLDTEIAEMRKSAESEAAAEEERIKVAAEEDRRKVIATAEQEIEAAANTARRELKAYAASLAVSIAEKKILIDANTDRSLVRTFVRELSHNGGKDGR
jgi:F-type H+-transporting ATPase subunit b